MRPTDPFRRGDPIKADKFETLRQDAYNQRIPVTGGLYARKTAMGMLLGSIASEAGVRAAKTDSSGIGGGGSGTVEEWMYTNGSWQATGITYTAYNFFSVVIPGSTKVFLASIGGVWTIIAQECG